MEYSRPRHSGYPAPRRVATAPIPLSTQFANPPSDGLVETLYNHPNAKIVSFTASGRAFSRSLGRSSVFPVDDEPGTLSWSSQLERTIAVGPFRIYRAPGSVAFLNCGSALQPILPKSQCWCIDEVNSKFVLQIRRPNYWRIELPVSDPEDQRRAQNLREVLDQILQFEKTECPFKRSFTVVLPERPQTPVKKRPWTPVRRSMPAMSVDGSFSPTSRSTPGLPQTPPSVSFTRGRGEDTKDWQGTQWTGSPVSKTLPESDESEGDSVSLYSLDNPRNPKAPYCPEQTPETCVGSSEDSVNPTHRETNDTSHVGPGQTAPKTPSEHRCVDDVRLTPQQLMLARVSTVESEVNITVGRVVSNSQEDQLVSPSVGESSPQPTVNEEDDTIVFELHEGIGSQREPMESRLRRRGRFSCARSFTSPPQLLLATEKPPTPCQETTPVPQLEPSPVTPTSEKSFSPNDDEVDRPQLQRRGSEDSFHSVQSWHSPTIPSLPSPPTSRPESPAMLPCPLEDLVVPKTRPLDHVPDETLVSDATAWDAATDDGSEASEESVATAPDSVTDKTEDTAPNGTVPDCDKERARSASFQRPTRSHRTTTTSISVRRRALSPLPPAANLFSPPSTSERRQPYRSKLETVKRIPMAIIAKTCEIIMGPPNHLISLMLKVAAKIAAGEWRGLVYGYDDFGEQIPVQWDYSEGEFSDWSDDEHFMGSHHRGHHPTRDQAAPDGLAAETGDASDDSRSWGVD